MWTSRILNIIILGIPALFYTMVEGQSNEEIRLWKKKPFSFTLSLCEQGTDSHGEKLCDVMKGPGYYLIEESRQGRTRYPSTYIMDRDPIRFVPDGYGHFQPRINNCCAQFCLQNQPIGERVCGPSPERNVPKGAVLGQAPKVTPPDAVAISCQSSPSCQPEN
ncbi:MAG: hypothetical protein M1823_005950 [Watsoniomyces obsoletus]|nr:MAG: hypothetical protein M1823_005950 [Watsoniomyces obsoletus]